MPSELADRTRTAETSCWVMMFRMFRSVNAAEKKRQILLNENWSALFNANRLKVSILSTIIIVIGIIIIITTI